MIGNENSAQSFSDRSFWESLRVVDVRAFRSWISAPFFQDFERPDRSLGRDIRANDPRMSAGYPSQKLPLWADFSFLTHVMNLDHLYTMGAFHWHRNQRNKTAKELLLAGSRRGPVLGRSLADVSTSIRRESSRGVEWLGVWNCIFSGSEFSNFGA